MPKCKTCNKKCRDINSEYCETCANLIISVMRMPGTQHNIDDIIKSVKENRIKENDSQ